MALIVNPTWEETAYVDVPLPTPAEPRRYVQTATSAVYVRGRLLSIEASDVPSKKGQSFTRYNLLMLVEDIAPTNKSVVDCVVVSPDGGVVEHATFACSGFPSGHSVTRGGVVSFGGTASMLPDKRPVPVAWSTVSVPLAARVGGDGNVYLDAVGPLTSIEGRGGPAALLGTMLREGADNHRTPFRTGGMVAAGSGGNGSYPGAIPFSTVGDTAVYVRSDPTVCLEELGDHALGYAAFREYHLSTKGGKDNPPFNVAIDVYQASAGPLGPVQTLFKHDLAGWCNGKGPVPFAGGVYGMSVMANLQFLFGNDSRRTSVAYRGAVFVSGSVTSMGKQPVNDADRERYGASIAPGCTLGNEKATMMLLDASGLACAEVAVPVIPGCAWEEEAAASMASRFSPFPVSPLSEAQRHDLTNRVPGTVAVLNSDTKGVLSGTRAESEDAPSGHDWHDGVIVVAVECGPVNARLWAKLAGKSVDDDDYAETCADTIQTPALLVVVPHAPTAAFFAENRRLPKRTDVGPPYAPPANGFRLLRPSSEAKDRMLLAEGILPDAMLLEAAEQQCAAMTPARDGASEGARGAKRRRSESTPPGEPPQKRSRDGSAAEADP